MYLLPVVLSARLTKPGVEAGGCCCCPEAGCEFVKYCNARAHTHTHTHRERERERETRGVLIRSVTAVLSRFQSAERLAMRGADNIR